MSLRARITFRRDEGVTLEHAQHCPIARLDWAKCTCGLFQGFDKPLRDGGNHAESCPCHCTCDFGQQMVKIISPRQLDTTPHLTGRKR